MSKKWQILADYLIKLTNDDILEWEDTALPDTYQVVIGGNSVEIVDTPEISEYVVIRLRNDVGNVVDAFRSNELPEGSNQYYEGAFRDILRLIRRKISGAEEVLDKVLSDLDERDPDRIPF